MSATVACMYLGDFFFCKFLDLRKNRDKISKGLCRNKCHFYCHNNIEHKRFVSCFYSVAIMILGMILKIHHCNGIFFKTCFGSKCKLPPAEVSFIVDTILHFSLCRLFCRCALFLSAHSKNE